MRTSISFHKIAWCEITEITKISVDPFQEQGLFLPFLTTTIKLTSQCGATIEIPIFGQNLKLITPAAKKQ